MSGNVERKRGDHQRCRTRIKALGGFIAIQWCRPDGRPLQTITLRSDEALKVADKIREVSNVRD
jgi:hypothetical protein